MIADNRSKVERTIKRLEYLRQNDKIEVKNTLEIRQTGGVSMGTLKKGTVITIGREFGSGGREIGKRLAELLSVPYYDGELLQEMSKKSGMRSEFLESFDEKRNIGLMYSLDVGMTSGFYGGGTTLGEQVYKAQVDTIKELAERSPCVIVGRRADKLLADEFNVVSVFISADDKDRIEHVMERDNCTKNEATKRVKKADRERASYYNFFSEGLWGRADNYDICLSTSDISKADAAQLILEYLKWRGVLEN